MKKFTFCLLIAFLSLSFIPSKLKAETVKSPVSIVTAETATIPVPIAAAITDESAEANANIARLEEIKAMDMSTLSRSEKKELRNEVRTIKSNQDGRGRRGHGYGHGNYDGRHGGGTVYLYGGSGLLIILLLILLL